MNIKTTPALSLADLESEEKLPELTTVTEEEDEVVDPKQEENEETDDENDDPNDSSEEQDDGEETSDDEQEDTEEDEEVEENKESDEEGEDTEDEDSDDSDDLDFFKDVAEELDFDYDIEDLDFEGEDPLGVKGTAKFVAHAVNKEILYFEEKFKENFPEAYSLLLHQMDGGSVEDFIKNYSGDISVPSIEEVSDSQEVQIRLVKAKIKEKGADDTFASKYVEHLIEEGALEAEALKIREDKAEALKSKIANREKEQGERAAADREKIAKVSNGLQTFLDKGKIGNITIPAKDRRAIIEELQPTLKVENGKVVSVVEVTEDNLEELLKRVTFGKNPKSLEKLITSKAKTINAKRLKRTLDTAQKKKAVTKRKTSNVSLQEIDFY